MKPVKVMPKFKCDFCKKRSIRSVMELHEKRCFRNPNRFCEFCDNKGVYTETYGDLVYDGDGGLRDDNVKCPYCSRFNPEQLKQIEAREQDLLNP